MGQVEAARLKRLAADLSSLAQIEEGVGTQVRVAVDLDELAETVARLLRPQYEDQKVELMVGGPGWR